MAASDEEDIKPTKTKRNVETNMEPPKLAILSLMSKFYLISCLVWMQVVVHMFENLYEWGEGKMGYQFVA